MPDPLDMPSTLAKRKHLSHPKLPPPSPPSSNLWKLPVGLTFLASLASAPRTATIPPPAPLWIPSLPQNLSGTHPTQILPPLTPKPSSPNPQDPTPGSPTNPKFASYQNPHQIAPRTLPKPPPNPFQTSKQPRTHSVGAMWKQCSNNNVANNTESWATAPK